jgi:hypothetical protein
MTQTLPQYPTGDGDRVAETASDRFKRWTREAVELSDHPDLPDDERLFCRLMVLSLELEKRRPPQAKTPQTPRKTTP